jgi:hypothetical protein
MSQQNENGLRAFTAGAAISQYRRVKLTSSGQVVHADVDDKGIGVAQIAADSGDPVTVKLWSAPGTMKMVAAGGISVNDVVYAADGGKVDDVVGAGAAVGRAIEAATANNDVVEVIPFADEHTGLIYSSTANSAAITNTNAETAFDKSVTIDGNELQVGDVFHVRLAGKVTVTNSTDTLNVKLYFGTEEIIATGALDVNDNDIFYVDAEITIEAIGGSGAVRGAGVTTIGAQGTATAKPFLKSTASEALNTDVPIVAKATWSVAHVNNSCRLEAISVTKKRQ